MKKMSISSNWDINFNLFCKTNPKQEQKKKRYFIKNKSNICNTCVVCMHYVCNSKKSRKKIRIIKKHNCHPKCVPWQNFCWWCTHIKFKYLILWFKKSLCTNVYGYVLVVVLDFEKTNKQNKKWIIKTRIRSIPGGWSVRVRFLYICRTNEDNKKKRILNWRHEYMIWFDTS